MNVMIPGRAAVAGTRVISTLFVLRLEEVIAILCLKGSL